MIYACDKCGFVFTRTGEIETCPDCSKQDIRLRKKSSRVTILEIIKYKKGRFYEYSKALDSIRLILPSNSYHFP